jgi:hypothetical protein
MVLLSETAMTSQRRNKKQGNVVMSTQHLNRLNRINQKFRDYND